MKLGMAADPARRWGFGARLLFVAYTQVASLVAGVAIAAALALAWGCSYATGGSHSAAPHLFYLPIILAAVRFSWPGTALTAIAAGVLAGPFLPAEVATGTDQPVQGWLLRLVAFLVVGVLIASLMRGRRDPLRAGVQDALTSARLVRGVHRGEVEVVYQPIYRLADLRIIGVEALTRWTDPRRGPVMPADFIPAAERTGAVTVLDAHVLRTAVAQTRVWSEEFGPLRSSVNVSGTRFERPDLAGEVARALAESGLASEELQLEITESALIGDVEDAARQVAQLRRLGVRIAIDDFGAGQASLAYLDHFEADTIKLDRAFLERATSNPRARRVLTAVARVRDDLQVDLVAEGIETEEQLELLRAIGVEYGQGFHLARPMPADQVARLLAGQAAPR